MDDETPLIEQIETHAEHIANLVANAQRVFETLREVEGQYAAAEAILADAKGKLKELTNQLVEEKINLV